jgi:hypothetical protein
MTPEQTVMDDSPIDVAPLGTPHANVLGGVDACVCQHRYVD